MGCPRSDGGQSRLCHRTERPSAVHRTKTSGRSVQFMKQTDFVVTLFNEAPRKPRFSGRFWYGQQTCAKGSAGTAAYSSMCIPLFPIRFQALPVRVPIYSSPASFHQEAGLDLFIRRLCQKTASDRPPPCRYLQCRSSQPGPLPHWG